MRKKFLIFLGFVLVFLTMQTVRNSSASASDWEMRCSKNKEGEILNCEAFQRLVDTKSKKRIAEMAITKNVKTEKWNMAFILPLGIHIPTGVAFGVDGTAQGKAVLSHCEQNGCVLFLEISKDEFLEKMKNGKQFNMGFKNVQGKVFNLNFSLKGFTKSIENI